MSYLVVLIIDDPDVCPDILESWENTGVGGITILESSGLGRIKRQGLRDDIPLLPSLSELFAEKEVHHRTLLTVVEDQATVDELVRLSECILGDLNEPNTGFLFVVPVVQVYGLRRNL
jgi:nitrogen regulatory protein P-II 1